MIVSESFIQSSKARDIEFTTNNGNGLLGHVINDTIHQVTVPSGLSYYANHKKHFPSGHVISVRDVGDRPLVVQFAASNAKDFADAAELVAPFADGVDLNCGCPQRYEGEASVEFVHTSPSHLPSRLPDVTHVTLSPRPSPSVFAYSLRSKTGGGNGLGRRLTDVHVALE